MSRHPIAASETGGAVDIERKWRRAQGAAAAVLAAAALAGCSSLSAEDFKTMLGGVGQVAQAAGEYEQARRNNRGNAAQGANAAGAQAAPATQAYVAPAAAYSALSCARVTPRGGGLCMENSCGGVVMVHARSGVGAFGPVALAPGQCAPIVPGTVAAFACRPGDRFDWQRAACVSS